jgi:hypothetical protein
MRKAQSHMELFTLHFCSITNTVDIKLTGKTDTYTLHHIGNSAPTKPMQTPSFSILAIPFNNNS